jgi:hypothetical protein
MSAWWQSVLSIVFGVLAVAVLGGGFVASVAIRSPSRGYRVAAISVAIGMPLGGVAFAIYLRELWPIPFMIGAAAFMALPMWLMSRFTRL